MKKRIAIYIVVPLLILCYSGFVPYWYLKDGVSKENYDQLEIGMTKGQVRWLLGFWPDATHHWVKGRPNEDWHGKDGTILLAFDEDNRLIWKDWIGGWRRPMVQERWERLGERIWYRVCEN